MRAVFAFALLVLAAGIALAGDKPAPQPPKLCAIGYELAPQQRGVLICYTKPGAPVARGIVVLASGHEDVDAALITRLRDNSTVFSVTNRSAAPVVGEARVEIW